MDLPTHNVDIFLIYVIIVIHKQEAEMEKLVISYEVSDGCTYSNEVTKCVLCESKDHFGVMFIEEMEKFQASEHNGIVLWRKFKDAKASKDSKKIDDASEKYSEWRTNKLKSLIVCGQDFSQFEEETLGDMKFDKDGKIISLELPKIQTLEEWFDSQVSK